MDNDKKLDNYIRLAQYINKINLESIIKSVMLGAAVGFASAFVFSFAGWLAELSYWWLAIIIFAVVTAAVTPLAYYKKYKPDLKDVARRLDRLGLEERVITMVELEGVDTVMAAHQLNSTIAALGGVTGKMLPVVVSVLGSVALGISTVFGAGMITVHALSANGYTPPASEIIASMNPDPEVYFVIRYQIVYVDASFNETDEYSGIEIYGNEEQIVLEGTDAEPVLLYTEEEPDDDSVWVFLGWYDVLDFTEIATSEDPYRHDTAVTLENAGSNVTYEDGETIITHYAIFTVQEEPEGDSGDGDGDEDGDQQDGDNPPDEPQDGDKQQNGDEPKKDDEQEGPANGAGSGKYDAGNQIIDGQQYYRDHFEDYLNEYQRFLEEGGDIPDYLKKFIETYYNIIK